MIYPWHQPHWNQWLTDSNLHHGLMVVGALGIGKWEFCMTLGQYLLCSDRTPEAGYCGTCQNCQLFAAGTHPDFHLLTSELENVDSRLTLVNKFGDRYQNTEARDKKAKPGKIISVDQVRQLISQFTNTPHISRDKVALIAPADCLNVNAANALLKLLEEPPEDSTLILMTPSPGKLPATVRSRCMVISLPTPRREDALRWLDESVDPNRATSALEMGHGGPLAAKKLIDSGEFDKQLQYLRQISDLLESRANPLDLAAELAKSDFPGLLVWLAQFVGSLIQWKVAAAEPKWFDVSTMKWSTRQISVDKLFLVYDRIEFYRGIEREPINVQLALEDLMLSLATVAR